MGEGRHLLKCKVISKGFRNAQTPSLLSSRQRRITKLITHMHPRTQRGHCFYVFEMSQIARHLGCSPAPRPQRWHRKRPAKACSAARASNSLKGGSGKSQNSGLKQLRQRMSRSGVTYRRESSGKPLLCTPPASACCPKVGWLRGRCSRK